MAFELVSENINGLKNSGEIVIPDTFTIAVAFISIIIKYALYVYKNAMGIRLKNDAIIADAKEHRSDVISTIGVLAGLALSIKVHPIFDPVAGMVVSVFIAKEGFMIIKETSDKILDTQDMEMVEKIRVYCNSFEEIYDTHDIILTYSGNKVFSSLHVRVDGKMTVEVAHKLSDDLKYSILSDFEEIFDVTIHLDPLAP
jgi:cation diffusion facilitator family transporter